MKTSVGQGVAITRADFRQRWRKARQSEYISDQEVDLVFGVFDKVKDGLLTLEEFSPEKTARWDLEKEKVKQDLDS